MLETIAYLHELMSSFRRSMGEIRHRARVRRQGPIREKERLGLLGPRPNYAYGLLKACDLARFVGAKKVTACEFGVATGDGLLAMCDLAAQLEPETGVEIRIVGFDTGSGLPQIEGYEDHPELWSPGDFPMADRMTLVNRVGDRAELIFGDITETVNGFVAGLSPQAPLGFISIDVDIYSGARSALRCLMGPADRYTPAIAIYLDDVGFYFANRWCGELRAVEEFNGAGEHRKIDRDYSIAKRSPEGWHARTFVAHILDHEIRRKPRERKVMGLGDHLEMMRSFGLV